MEWLEAVRMLVGAAVLAIPVLLLLVVAFYIALMPLSFLAGLAIRLYEDTVSILRH